MRRLLVPFRRQRGYIDIFDVTALASQGGSPANFGELVQALGVDGGLDDPDQQTYPGSVTVGNILIAVIRAGNAAENYVSSVSDDVNGAWTRAKSQVATADHDLEIWYCLNTAAGTPTVTCDLTASVTIRWIIAEYVGNGASSTFTAGEISGATGSGTGADSGGVTTSKAKSLLVGGNSSSGDSTFTATGSFTEDYEVVQRINLQSRVVSSTGTYNSTCTLGTSVTWAAALVAISDGV